MSATATVYTASTAARRRGTTHTSEAGRLGEARPTVKLTTIWTAPAMSLPERLRRTRECAIRAAAHRLPRSLAYWSLIDTGARHIAADEVVPEVRFTAILERASKGVAA